MKISNGTPSNRNNLSEIQNLDTIFLKYIEENKPTGNFEDLIKQLDSSIPYNYKASLVTIEQGLMYVSAELKNNPHYSNYIKNYLNKESMKGLLLEVVEQPMIEKLSDPTQGKETPW